MSNGYGRARALGFRCAPVAKTLRLAVNSKREHWTLPPRDLWGYRIDYGTVDACRTRGRLFTLAGYVSNRGLDIHSTMARA